MKCPSCNKFCGFEAGDPEIELEVSSELEETPDEASPEVQKDKDKASAQVTGTVRIVLNTECCSEEAKETTFDVDVQLDVERAEGCECDLTELEVDEPSMDVEDRMETFTEKLCKRGPNKGKMVRRDIPYRFQKKFWGASGTIEVKCSCGKTTASHDWKDEVQASGMEELC